MPTAHSSETGRTYHLDRLIGKGGFGEVYLATPTPREELPAHVVTVIGEKQFWRLVESASRQAYRGPCIREAP